MRILQVKLKDGTILLLRVEYQDSGLHPDQTDAVEKVKGILDDLSGLSGAGCSSPIAETRVLASR